MFVLADASRVSAQGVLFFPRTDGSVPGIDVTTGAEVALLRANVFLGANPGGARNVAFDPQSRLMWYSATDGQIHSVHTATMAAGPDILNIPGANEGAGRHLFIDYSRRTLLTPITDGSVPIYDLATLQLVRSIPATLFTDGNVGGFRHFAADVCTRTLWYAATDGSFREMEPEGMTHTGRRILFTAQRGANPGAFRHFVIDPVRRLLLYCVTDGSVASIDLNTLLAGTFTISSAAFTGANPGAGRTITYDIQPPANCGAAADLILQIARLPSADGVTLIWNNLGANYRYTVQSRNSLTEGNWLPVPPVNQWPIGQTGWTNPSSSGPNQFYRLAAELSAP